MQDEKSSTESETMIARLIAAAGPGQTAGAEARARVYASVRAHWETVVAGAAGDRRKRGRAAAGFGRRRGLWNARTIGMAAAVAALALSLSWLTRPPETSSIDTGLAQYTLVSGTTGVRRRDASAEALAAGTSGAVRAGDTLTTGSDGRVELRRPDGLLIRMNGSSEIRFIGPDEIDLVAGTIYVDSGNSVPGQTLEVDTPLGGIEHVGTQYEVRYANAALRIRVREGRVAYRGTTEAVGLAGEQLDVDAAGPARRSAIAANDPEWDWAIALATLPAADQYRLGETLAWIARETGYTLEYAPGARRTLAGQTILGLEGLNPTEALAAIEQIAELQAEASGDRLVISN